MLSFPRCFSKCILASEGLKSREPGGMIMGKVLKRFLYYWRIPLLFIILFFVLLWIATSVSEPAASIFSCIWLFVDIPCLVGFTIYAIVKRIRNIIEHISTGIPVEDFSFPELDALETIGYVISDTFEMVKSLSFRMKFRFFGFRILSVVLIAAGCVGCFFFSSSIVMIVLFTLLIIGGATLWILANPKKFNAKVSGARMIPCPTEVTLNRIYKSLREISTLLGLPCFASVRGFKEPIIVYGSERDEYIYVVYRPKKRDFLYVSTLSSIMLEESIAKDSDDEGNDEVVQEFDFYLEDIAKTVELAVERAK